MKRSVFCCGLIVGLIIGVAGVEALHGQGAGRAAPKDEFLDKLVGEWEYKGKIATQAGDAKFTATETVEWVCQEQFLLSRMTQISETGNRSFDILTLTRAEPGTGKIRQWVFESHGMAETAEGSRDGDTFVTESDGPAGKTRTKYEISDDGTLKIKVDGMAPPHKDWTPFVEMEGKRVDEGEKEAGGEEEGK